MANICKYIDVVVSAKPRIFMCLDFEDIGRFFANFNFESFEFLNLKSMFRFKNFTLFKVNLLRKFTNKCSPQICS